MMMCHFRSEMSELKTCQFCGGEAELCYSEVDTFCRKCNDIQETEMWNTRPIEDELRARIAELEAAQRWIPVSERLPEHGDFVLAWDNEIIEVLKYIRTFGGEWFIDIADAAVYPTH